MRIFSLLGPRARGAPLESKNSFKFLAMVEQSGLALKLMPILLNWLKITSLMLLKIGCERWICEFVPRRTASMYLKSIKYSPHCMKILQLGDADPEAVLI